ncbi:hypothetical protein DFH07DRAFT_801730 [Mycena maculata]|uniref:Uncharacterized protein n=1 Tax=Mycena maculata TaxID=230809 RepID=A0AAD7NS09_9AGAR|nr:hypothetical protein DFH07DRAFT_801730 [Mycena maculata]
MASKMGPYGRNSMRVHLAAPGGEACSRYRDAAAPGNSAGVLSIELKLSWKRLRQASVLIGLGAWSGVFSVLVCHVCSTRAAAIPARRSRRDNLVSRPWVLPALKGATMIPLAITVFSNHPLGYFLRESTQN